MHRREKSDRENDNLDESIRGKNKGEGRIDIILYLENSISLGKVGIMTHQNIDI